MTKKKAVLLKKTGNSSITMRNFLRNLKENDLHYENKQITQCVFLGVLRLKPVPSIFRSNDSKSMISAKASASKVIANLRNNNSVNIINKNAIKKDNSNKPSTSGKVHKPNPQKVKAAVKKGTTKTAFKIKLKEKSKKKTEKDLKKGNTQKPNDAPSKTQKNKTPTKSLHNNKNEVKKLPGKVLNSSKNTPIKPNKEYNENIKKKPSPIKEVKMTQSKISPVKTLLNKMQQNISINSESLTLRNGKKSPSTEKTLISCKKNSQDVTSNLSVKRKDTASDANVELRKKPKKTNIYERKTMPLKSPSPIVIDVDLDDQNQLDKNINTKDDVIILSDESKSATPIVFSENVALDDDDDDVIVVQDNVKPKNDDLIYINTTAKNCTKLKERTSPRSLHILETQKEGFKEDTKNKEITKSEKDEIIMISDDNVVPTNKISSPKQSVNEILTLSVDTSGENEVKVVSKLKERTSPRFKVELDPDVTIIDDENDVNIPLKTLRTSPRSRSLNNLNEKSAIKECTELKEKPSKRLTSPKSISKSIDNTIHNKTESVNIDECNTEDVKKRKAGRPPKPKPCIQEISLNVSNTKVDNNLEEGNLTGHSETAKKKKVGRPVKSTEISSSLSNTMKEINLSDQGNLCSYVNTHVKMKKVGRPSKSQTTQETSMNLSNVQLGKKLDEKNKLHHEDNIEEDKNKNVGRSINQKSLVQEASLSLPNPKIEADDNLCNVVNIESSQKKKIGKSSKLQSSIPETFTSTKFHEENSLSDIKIGEAKKKKVGRPSRPKPVIQETLLNVPSSKIIIELDEESDSHGIEEVGKKSKSFEEPSLNISKTKIGTDMNEQNKCEDVKKKKVVCPSKSKQSTTETSLRESHAKQDILLDKQNNSLSDINIQGVKKKDNKSSKSSVTLALPDTKISTDLSEENNLHTDHIKKKKVGRPSKPKPLIQETSLSELNTKIDLVLNEESDLCSQVNIGEVEKKIDRPLNRKSAQGTSLDLNNTKIATNEKNNLHNETIKRKSISESSKPKPLIEEIFLNASNTKVEEVLDEENDSCIEIIAENKEIKKDNRSSKTKILQGTSNTNIDIDLSEEHLHSEIVTKKKVGRPFKPKPSTHETSSNLSNSKLELNRKHNSSTNPKTNEIFEIKKRKKNGRPPKNILNKTSTTLINEILRDVKKETLNDEVEAIDCENTRKIRKSRNSLPISQNDKPQIEVIEVSETVLLISKIEIKPKGRVGRPPKIKKESIETPQEVAQISPKVLRNRNNKVNEDSAIVIEEVPNNTLDVDVNNKKVNTPRKRSKNRQETTNLEIVEIDKKVTVPHEIAKESSSEIITTDTTPSPPAPTISNYEPPGNSTHPSPARKVKLAKKTDKSQKWPVPLKDLYEFDDTEVEEIAVLRTPSPKKTVEVNNIFLKDEKPLLRSAFKEPPSLCVDETKPEEIKPNVQQLNVENKKPRGRPKKNSLIQDDENSQNNTTITTPKKISKTKTNKSQIITNKVEAIENTTASVNSSIKIEPLNVSSDKQSPPTTKKSISPQKPHLKQQSIKEMFQAAALKKERQAAIDAVFARPAQPQLSPKENIPATDQKPNGQSDNFEKKPLMETNNLSQSRNEEDDEDDDDDDDSRSKMEWMPEDYAEYKFKFQAKKLEVFKGLQKCKICLMTFTSYYMLNKHKKIHISSANPYECPTCQDSFNDIDIFNAHLREHKGKPPYTCKKCNKGFWTKKSLETHEPVHVLKKVKGPNKRFRCDVCAKEFAKLCDMERHMRVHTGEKPCICNICHKGFQQSHNLSKHLLTHLHVKPYNCDICNKKFGRHDVLNRHLLTHSIEKPFKCNDCNKGFIRQVQLDQHISKHHKNKEKSANT